MRSVKLLISLSLILFALVIYAHNSNDKDLVERISTISFALLIVLSACYVLDFLAALRQPKVRLSRLKLRSCAVNHWLKMNVDFEHQFTKSTSITIFDMVIGRVELSDMPRQVELVPQRDSRAIYKIKPLDRGDLVIDGCHVRVPSPMGLWNTQYLSEEKTIIKVYPDFTAVTAYTILATDNHTSQLGIKKKPRRGEGMEFMQLREYRRGDSMRQVDWKATSRRQKLISKEYQDERDQQIVLLIDSGRRMRALDGDLNHFDHSLNAALLLSYIALRQGDSVGVMTFGGEDRWIAPVKGAASMKVILNSLYDVHSTNHASDYVAAAESLANIQKKRSLVILMTNSRDEDVDELSTAATLLQRRHLVLLANIREVIIDKILKDRVYNLDSALSYISAGQFLELRKEMHSRVASRGIYTLDCLAKELAVRVSNSYLEIKRTGVL